MKYLKLSVYSLAILFSGLIFLQSCSKENIDETEFNPQIVDCSELDEGDACFTDDGLAGFVSALDGEDCECIPFDCQNFNGNAGAECTTDNGSPGTIIILTDGSCECTDEFTYDCEEYQANIGDVCPIDIYIDGILDDNCECIENDVDCPTWNANIGDMCLLGEDEYGTLNDNCECVE